MVLEIWGITMLIQWRYRIRHWIPMFIGTPCTLWCFAVETVKLFLFQMQIWFIFFKIQIWFIFSKYKYDLYFPNTNMIYIFQRFSDEKLKTTVYFCFFTITCQFQNPFKSFKFISFRVEGMFSNFIPSWIVVFIFNDPLFK